MVVESLVGSLVTPSMHYEHMLGSLEVHFRRHTPDRQAFYSLYGWLIELVYHLLYYRHVNSEHYLGRALRFIEGIAGLANENTPLWIFTLNHDLIVECLAAHYNIPLDCGIHDVSNNAASQQTRYAIWRTSNSIPRHRGLKLTGTGLQKFIPAGHQPD